MVRATMLRAAPLFALLLAWPTLARPAAQDDDGWIEFDDEGAAEEGWQEFEEPEAPPTPAAPPVDEGTPPGSPQDPEGNGSEGGEAAPAPAPVAPPEAPVGPFELSSCPAFDPQVVPPGRERVVVLPLVDKARSPDDTGALTLATVAGLADVPGYRYPEVPLLEPGEEAPPDWQPPDPIATGEPRFEVIDGRCFEGRVSEEVLYEISSCQRSTCMGGIASATGAGFLVYGALLNPGPRVYVAELKIFDAKKGRIVNRAVAEAPVTAVLPNYVPAVLEQLVPLPDPPPPPKARPREPTVLESPIFIGGATVALVGVVGLVAAGAYLIDAEIKLSTPEVHRDLKAQARTNWPFIAAAGAVMPFVIAAGAAAMGVSPFLLPDVEEPAEGESP